MRPNRGMEKTPPTNRIFPIIVCLISFLALFIISCSKEEEQSTVKEVVRPVKVITVDAGGEVSGLKFPGKVRAARRVELAFKVVGGRLFKLPIAGKEGGYVKKGELLARIDPKDFQTDLRNAEGQLKEAEAALDLAKSEYARIQRIMKEDPGATSQAMVDRRREAVNQAQHSLLQLFVAAMGDIARLEGTNSPPAALRKDISGPGRWQIESRVRAGIVVQ